MYVSINIERLFSVVHVGAAVYLLASLLAPDSESNRERLVWKVSFITKDYCCIVRHDGQSCRPFYSIRSFCLKCFDPTLASLFEMAVSEEVRVLMQQLHAQIEKEKRRTSRTTC